MAKSDKNDDDKVPAPAAAVATPQPEGETRVVAGAPQSPKRDSGTDHVEDVEGPTPAAGSILVDASEATKAADQDLYETYIGVDEDRKRVPAGDAQRPYWGEGEQEALREAKESHDANVLRRTVAERRADSEVAREEHEAEVKRLMDERKSQNKD